MTDVRMVNRSAGTMQALEAKENQPHIPDVIEELRLDAEGRSVCHKFMKGKLLGKGGFGRCYVGTLTATKSVYALKIVSKSMIVRSKTKQKLQSEIRIHRNLRHINVVRFDRYFEDIHNVYIVLELCANNSMSELLKRRKKLIEAEVRFYLQQLIESLKYLHKALIIHRDLKLGNLFIDSHMRIKVGDFGLAAKLTHPDERKKTVCGTPNYLAPEILEGKDGHSFEVDIWSTGVVMYTLLVGKPPFESKDVKSTYRRIVSNTYSFPEHTTISEDAKNLIRMMLQHRPERRPSLDDIISHSFFTNGFMPSSLPESALRETPVLLGSSVHTNSNNHIISSSSYNGSTCSSGAAYTTTSASSSASSSVVASGVPTATTGAVHDKMKAYSSLASQPRIGDENDAGALNRANQMPTGADDIHHSGGASGLVKSTLGRVIRTAPSSLGQENPASRLHRPLSTQRPSSSGAVNTITASVLAAATAATAVSEQDDDVVPASMASLRKAPLKSSAVGLQHPIRTTQSAASGSIAVAQSGMQLPEHASHGSVRQQPQPQPQQQQPLGLNSGVSGSLAASALTSATSASSRVSTRSRLQSTHAPTSSSTRKFEVFDEAATVATGHTLASSSSSSSSRSVYSQSKQQLVGNQQHEDEPTDIVPQRKVLATTSTSSHRTTTTSLSATTSSIVDSASKVEGGYLQRHSARLRSTSSTRMVSDRAVNEVQAELDGMQLSSSSSDDNSSRTATSNHHPSKKIALGATPSYSLRSATPQSWAMAHAASSSSSTTGVATGHPSTPGAMSSPSLPTPPPTSASQSAAVSTPSSAINYGSSSSSSSSSLLPSAAASTAAAADYATKFTTPKMAVPTVREPKGTLEEMHAMLDENSYLNNACFQGNMTANTTAAVAAVRSKANTTVMPPVPPTTRSRVGNGGSASLSSPSASNVPVAAESTPTSSVWVVRYVDYTSKYGLGYLLSTGNTGVYFNDSSKIILSADGAVFQYIEKTSSSVASKKSKSSSDNANGNNADGSNSSGAGNSSPTAGHSADSYSVQTHSINNYPVELQKKVTLSRHFRNYLIEQQKLSRSNPISGAGDGQNDDLQSLPMLPMLPDASTTTGANPNIKLGTSSVRYMGIDGDATSADDAHAPIGNGDSVEMVFVKKWVRTKHAILFRLSNRTVQVLFFDKSEILLSSEAHVVTYVNKQGQRSEHTLDQIMNPTSTRTDIAKRLRYTKDIMHRLINLQSK